MNNFRFSVRPNNLIGIRNYSLIMEDLQLRTFFQKILFNPDEVKIVDVQKVMGTIESLIKTIEELEHEIKELKVKDV